jgi:hypothetical protein
VSTKDRLLEVVLQARGPVDSAVALEFGVSAGHGSEVRPEAFLANPMARSAVRDWGEKVVETVEGLVPAPEIFWDRSLPVCPWLLSLLSLWQVVREIHVGAFWRTPRHNLHPGLHFQDKGNDENLYMNVSYLSVVVSLGLAPTLHIAGSMLRDGL